MNILVVDDLEPVALTYKAILLRAGYEVEAFTKPAEAIEHIQNYGHLYDLVVTDIYMNDFNGLHIIHAAKQANPNIKTLTITGGGGFDQDTSLMQTARVESDYMAFKPIHSGQLTGMVENLLRERKKQINAA